MNNNLLINHIVNKNTEEFKIFFHHFYSDLVHFANQFLFDKDASEDIVQEVFIYIWENAHKLNIDKSIKAYVFTMVRNRCLNYLRSINVSNRLGILDIQASLLVDVQLDSLSGEERLELKKQADIILESLPDKMRKIFKLRVINEYSYAEIAKELNISLNSVKTQLRRARTKIERSTNFILIIIAFYMHSS